MHKAHLVEEVNSLHRKPLVDVLTLGQCHCLSEVATAESAFCMLVEEKLLGAGSVATTRLECVGLVARPPRGEVHQSLLFP